MSQSGDFEIEFMKMIKNKVPKGIMNGAKKVALRMLNDCLEEEPKTPWRTGLLRSTGSAFVDKELAAVSPVTLRYNSNSNRKRDPRSINERKLLRSPISPEPATIQIAVVFNASYASIVHEMPSSYKFTYPGSGPQFVLAKLKRYNQDYMEIMNKTLQRYMS